MLRYSMPSISYTAESNLPLSSKRVNLAFFRAEPASIAAHTENITIVANAPIVTSATNPMKIYQISSPAISSISTARAAPAISSILSPQFSITHGKKFVNPCNLLAFPVVLYNVRTFSFMRFSFIFSCAFPGAASFFVTLLDFSP